MCYLLLFNEYSVYPIRVTKNTADEMVSAIKQNDNIQYHCPMKRVDDEDYESTKELLIQDGYIFWN